MTGGFGLALAGAALVIITIFEMVRRRYVRGRFAVIWTIVGVITVVLALAPGALDWAARVTGVAVPLNLLLFVGFLGLLLILIQLTAEVGRLDKRMQRMAEEMALLRMEQEAQEHATGSQRQRANRTD